MLDGDEHGPAVQDGGLRSPHGDPLAPNADIVPDPQMAETVGGHAVIDDPQQFLPQLYKAFGGDWIVFTLTMDGQIRYISDAAKSILRREPGSMIGKFFVDFLSDSMRNDEIRKLCWRDVPPGTPLRCNCEVLDGNGTPRPLHMYNVVLGEPGQPLGLAGLALIDHLNAAAGVDLESPETQRILKLADRLTDAERAVVELVVDGHMNKSMARLLGVAVRTIEARRARAMSKLMVRSLSELVQVWMIVRSASKAKA